MPGMSSRSSTERNGPWDVRQSTIFCAVTSRYNHGMKIIGYLRVSQVADRDGDRFISPDVQRETIKRFITGKGHTLIDVVDDLDESGGTLNRPGLDRVLGRLEAGEADGLAVAYLSRLSRRVIDGLGLAQRLRDSGRALLVADLDLDTSTPTGKAMLGVALAFAELELDTRRESWATSQMRAIRRGVYPGSTPIGFTRDNDGRMIPDSVAGPRSCACLSGARPARPGRNWRATSTRSCRARTAQHGGRARSRTCSRRRCTSAVSNARSAASPWSSTRTRAARLPRPVGDGRERQAGRARAVAPGAACRARRARPLRLLRRPDVARYGGQKRGADGKVRVYDAYVCLNRCDRQQRSASGSRTTTSSARSIDRLAASRAVGTARTPGDNELDALERALEHEAAEQAAFHRAVSVLDMGEAAYRRAAREKRNGWPRHNGDSSPRRRARRRPGRCTSSCWSSCATRPRRTGSGTRYCGSSSTRSSSRSRASRAAAVTSPSGSALPSEATMRRRRVKLGEDSAGSGRPSPRSLSPSARAAACALARCSARAVPDPGRAETAACWLP